MALGHVHIIFLLSSLTAHESIGRDEIGSGSGKTSPFSPCSSRSSSALMMGVVIEDVTRSLVFDRGTVGWMLWQEKSRMY
jgi:hypothetical protein